MLEDKSTGEITRLTALSEVSLALSETLSLDKLLYKAVTQCIDILGFDAAVVYFLDQDGTYFEAKHFHGIPDETIDKLQKLPTDCVGGIVVKSGKTVVTDLVRYYQQRPQIEEFTSLVSVPIKARRESIGVLDVYSREQRDFYPEDISLIESIGLQLGVASENAKLFESVENLSIKLRELVELSHKLSSCLRLDALLDLLTTELSNVFKAEVLFFSLTDETDAMQVHVHTNSGTGGFQICDEDMQRLFRCDPGQVFRYCNKQNDRQPDRFFGELGIRSALFVNLQYKEKRHCLIIGKRVDYEWKSYEWEVMDGISKTIALALTNCYLFLEVEKSRNLHSELLSLQVTAQEKERQRIAREIHDSINQSIAGIYFHLQYCRDEVSHSPEKVMPILDKLLRMTKDNMNELQQIIYDLHPIAIQKFGFVGAIEELATTYSLQGVLQIAIEVSGEPVRYEANVEINLYRVIQECINNIIKHSQADRAGIYLFFDPALLRIIVIDRGVGFDMQQKLNQEKSYGLIGMKRRISDLGGHMSIASQAGKGTTVEIILSHRTLKKSIGER